MVGIIDYGMGNLQSVANALRYLQADVTLAARPADLRTCRAIVLPGVGAFGDGMRNLRERGFVEALQTEVRRKGKPFLGICLGMQLLAGLGLEHGRNEGLGWVPGVVDRLPSGLEYPGLRVPHIGWNDVRFVKQDGLYAGLGPAQAFYFVHSYKLEPSDRAGVSGVCTHGVDFAASLEVENLWATQFHPEKSHQAGLTVLRNFLRRAQRMLKTRLIPVLLLQNGLLVRSERFAVHQVIGNPLHEVRRFNEWNVDELIYLDITRDDHYDLRRDDQKDRGLDGPLAILDRVSTTCFMPLTWGGHLRSVEQMRACFRHGADKVTLNSAAVRDPALITGGAQVFGSQAVVVSIDVRRRADGRAEVMIDGGRTPTDKDPADWAREAEDRGAGEILLQSIDRDGTGLGYDTELIHAVATRVGVPVIACSGVGGYEHYAAGVRAGASAVAAANLWHFKELSDRGGKRALARAGVNVRL